MRPVPLHRFRPRLLDSLKGYSRQRFAADAGAGLTVGIVALPLAMAFAIASGVKPEAGLFTAIIAGFLISALGGSNVQIGGPAGAFIVIVYGIVERYGLANLLISTILAGVLLFVMGLLRLGALVRYVPVNIVIGFTNGIAVLIALSQVRDLLGLQIDKLPADFFSQLRAFGQALHTFNPYAFALGMLCFLGLFLWPRLFRRGHVLPGVQLPGRLTEASFFMAAARMPGQIVALVTLTTASTLLALPVETIGSRFGGIPQALPAFALPAFSWQTVQQLFIPTLTIALLGAVESLLCARVADSLGAAAFPRHDPNQELMAQGVANVVAPFFGGIPATGTIARTVTNLRAGAATPVAGMVHAATLLLVVLLAAPLALYVPLAVLAGILLFVAWNMGEWHEFARLRQFSFAYRTTLLGTFVLTVVFDLTVAVQVGLVLACVFFIWRMGTLFRAETSVPPSPPGVQVVHLYGALFFGAVGKVEDLAEHVPPGTRLMILEMHRLVSMDASGLDALVQLHGALQRRGVRLVLADMNEQPRSLVQRGGLAARLGPGGMADTLDAALRSAAEAAAGTSATVDVPPAAPVPAPRL
ncbi:SulP family inorganic anion transporter [Aquincola sp. MAHUQ-54]|uniref:SulP family inorganic anion transporter n=1 Tax=Aquincola agrisoli TaxID=3119538 RepID=A0AAW9Q0R8_9BURK